MEERVTKVEGRLGVIEMNFKRLRKTVHDMKDEQQVLVSEFGKAKTQLDDVQVSTDKIVTFFEGTDKLLGFTKKHWRTMLKFGCGFVTAYGLTNPAVARSVLFVQHFFSL